jgi:hypothetical protein
MPGEPDEDDAMEMLLDALDAIEQRLDRVEAEIAPPSDSVRRDSNTPIVGGYRSPVEDEDEIKVEPLSGGDHRYL